MSGGNLSRVYHFYTMAVTAATMVQYVIYNVSSWSKKRRRNYVRASSKSVLGGRIRPVTPVLFISTIRDRIRKPTG